MAPSKLSRHRFAARCFGVFALLMTASTAIAQPPAVTPPTDDYVVQHYGAADGLPPKPVTDIAQDRDGYLWLAGFDGLLRFDGAHVTRFQTHDYPNLPSNRVVRLAAVADGDVWLLTENGRIARWNGHAFSLPLVHDAPPPGKVTKLRRDGVGDLWVIAEAGIYRAHAGELDLRCALPRSLHVTDVAAISNSEQWIATAADGLWRCRENQATPWRAHGLDRLHAIDALGLGADDMLWLATDAGVFRYDGTRLTATVYADSRGPPPHGLAFDFGPATAPGTWLETDHGVYRIVDDTVTLAVANAVPPISQHDAVQYDDAGARWSSVGNDLYRNTTRVFHAPSAIANVVVGPGRGLFVATDADGLYRLRPAAGTLLGTAQGLGDSIVYALAPSTRYPGRVWATTLFHRLHYIENMQAHAYDIPELTEHNRVLWSVLEESDGTLWIGGSTLCRVVGQRCDDQGLPPALTSGEGAGADIRMLFEDDTHDLWVGSGVGLFRRHANQWQRLEDAPNDVVRVGLQRADGSLVFGSNGSGLLFWRDGKLRQLGPAQGLASSLIRSLHEDVDGMLWVGSEDIGLIRLQLDDHDNIVRQLAFDTHSGLWDNTIHQILEDDRGYLWMNSNRGIFRVRRAQLVTGNANTQLEVTGFNETSGLRGGEGNGGIHAAGFRDARGRFWFPGQAGIVVVDPRADAAPALSPQALIEQVLVDDHVIGAETTLPAHTRRDIALRYTAALFDDTGRLRFRYRLDGFDAQWIDAGERREAFYTNLAAGNYRFIVNAGGADGRWSDREASFAFGFAPRFYETRWFLLGMILIAGVVLFGLVRWRLDGLRRRARALEDEVGLRTHELAEEKLRVERTLLKVESQARELAALDETKSRFFANLSHELRSPLAMIVGPAEHLIARDGTDSAAAGIGRNAERLLRLVDQILDLARLDAGMPRPATSAGDVARLCRDAVAQHRDEAIRRAISLTGPADEWVCEARIDADAIDKILANLLDNALRHCNAGGNINVSLSRLDDGVSIEVGDDGEGIAADQLPHLFERYYSHRREGTGAGTGIGLSLCRELARGCGGDIRADSRIGEGSLFRVVLPLQIDRWQVGLPLGGSAPVAPIERPLAVDDAATHGADVTTVLVVEDQSELRQFIGDCLRGHYRVIEAADGIDGLRCARDHLPDVVVSDVMMPRMSGTQLVRNLRDDPRTAAMPVILLTALADPHTEQLGFEAGALDYVRKPFSPDILLARVQRLLDFRLRLRHHLRQHWLDAGLVPAAHGKLPLQERVLAAIATHLADPEFDVDALAASLHVSRSKLKRSLHEAGLDAPSSMIRNARLDEARRLLAARRGTVSEVAYAVGFSSLSHFSACFKEYFNCSPTQFQRQLTEASAAIHDGDEDRKRESTGSGYD